MLKLFYDLKNISKYLIFPLIVFFVHVIFLFYLNIYSSYPWLDIPMHLLGGISFGFVFVFSLKYFENEGYFRLNKTANFIFVVSLVALVAVLWEFFEFGLEYFTGFNFQGTIEDTMVDFFMGLLGAVFANFIFRN